MDVCFFVLKAVWPSFSSTLTLGCIENNIWLQPHNFTTSTVFLNFSTSTYDISAVLYLFLLPEYLNNIYLEIHLSPQPLATTCCLPVSVIELHVFLTSAIVRTESESRYFTVTQNGDLRRKTVLQRYKMLWKYKFTPQFSLIGVGINVTHFRIKIVRGRTLS